MTLIIDIGRDKGEASAFHWKPGRFRSRVVTRVWWLWFAVGVLHVSHLEYARTSYDWIGERGRRQRAT